MHIDNFIIFSLSLIFYSKFSKKFYKILFRFKNKLIKRLTISRMDDVVVLNTGDIKCHYTVVFHVAGVVEFTCSCFVKKRCFLTEVLKFDLMQQYI